MYRSCSVSWLYVMTGVPFSPDKSPCQSASSPLQFHRLRLSHLVWQFPSPNYSFKGNNNRSDCRPLNSGVRQRDFVSGATHQIGKRHCSICVSWRHPGFAHRSGQLLSPASSPAAPHITTMGSTGPATPLRRRRVIISPVPSPRFARLPRKLLRFHRALAPVSSA